MTFFKLSVNFAAVASVIGTLMGFNPAALVNDNS